VLGGSRLPFALSSEKQFPKVFSYVNPIHLTPTWSLLLFIAVTTVVSLVWSFFAALTIGSIIRVLVYLMVCISMIRLRMKDKGGEDFFKLRFGYVFAGIGIVLAIWLLAGLKFSEARDVSICIV